MNYRHFVCFPIADPRNRFDAVWAWEKAGYDVLFMLDKGVYVSDTLFRGTRPCLWEMHCEEETFPGYYRVINKIVAEAFSDPYAADLVTCIGDDMDPPAQGAEAVAQAYFSRFPNGEGVMQGCGDPQGDKIDGKAAAARICGSPTFGRGWFERSPYGAGKPFHDGYRSFYADEDLWNIAKKLGLLWMNPEVTIFHRHWSWGHMKRQPYHERAQANWEADRQLFERRKAEGFEHL